MREERSLEDEARRLRRMFYLTLVSGALAGLTAYLAVASYGLAPLGFDATGLGFAAGVAAFLGSLMLGFLKYEKPALDLEARTIAEEAQGRNPEQRPKALASGWSFPEDGEFLRRVFIAFPVQRVLRLDDGDNHPQMILIPADEILPFLAYRHPRDASPVGEAKPAAPPPPREEHSSREADGGAGEEPGPQPRSPTASLEHSLDLRDLRLKCSSCGEWVHPLVTLDGRGICPRCNNQLFTLHPDGRLEFQLPSNSLLASVPEGCGDS